MRYFLFILLHFLATATGFAQSINIEDARLEKESLERAQALYKKGLIALKQNPADGIILLQEAKFIFKNRKKIEREIDCILALAEVYVRLSDYDLAYSLLTNASSMSLEHDLPDQHLMSLGSLGRLSAYLGDYQRATSFFTDSYKLSEETHKYPQQLLSKAHISYINFYYLKDYSDSNFVRIKELYNLVSSPPVDTLMMLSATNLMAGAYNYIKKNPERAAFYYNQSIQLAMLANDKYRVSLVSSNLGEMWINAGNTNEAERTLLHSLQIAREVNSKLLIYNCFRLLSKCAENRSDFEKALALFKSYGEIKEEVLNESLIRKTQQNHSLDELERKAREAERISNEKMLAEIKSEKIIRNYQVLSIIVSLFFISLVIFAFLNRRQLQKFRRQNLIIEDQNFTLQNLNKDLIEQRMFAQKANLEAELAIQSKIDFLSIMTHEIRTPINAVIGTVQLLQEENPPVHQHKSLDILRFSADNLLNLVNDILDFNKIEAGKIELDNQPFSLRNLLQNIKNSLQLKADEKGLELKLRIDKNLSEAFLGDKLRLGQVFYNLISNAVKFTEKGKVEIEVRYYPKEIGNNIFASIKDTGIGIEPEKQDKIFDFFSQADPGISRKFGGSGLGLTITKNLLNLMNSHIQLESKPGVGSRFSFNLFLMETNASFLDEVETDKQTNDIDLSAVSILFVDDLDYNKVIAERFFRKWNLSFDSASNSAKAISLASSKEYDLILMDLQLPDLDGYETVRIIRESTRNKQTPVLATTAYGFYEIKDKLTLYNIEGFISKPFVAQDLLKSIVSWSLKKRTAFHNP